MLKVVFKSDGKNQQRYSRICKQAWKPCLSPYWDVPIRWNFTYHMFLSGLKKYTLMYFHDLLASKNRCHQFSAKNWVIIEGLTQLLEVFNNATKRLLRVYYPTSPLVLQQVVFMTTKLTEYEFEGGIFATIVKLMKEKLKKYFERMPPIITCASTLNPCFNVHGVEFLIESISTDLEFFDDSYVTKAKNGSPTRSKVCIIFIIKKYGNPTTTKSSSGGGGSSSRASHRNQVTTLLRRLKEHKNKKARSDPLLSSKYERYVHSDFVTHLLATEFETFDVLGFWKAKEIMFPVLSRIAMDLLSVQATLVASESAFSTSGRVLSIQRTRLTPASLEMCLCLKDHLDTQERKQDKSTLETPVDFEEEILDAEVQANEAIPLSDEEIALNAASSEGSMSRPGSGGEEAEAEANYGYDVYHDDY
ncbi:zinc finger BED domain-containing protein RICESLEEPER 2-like protein [Tanacetum coccineum]